MKKNKKNGFGSVEFFIVSLVCLVLSWVVLSIALNSQEKERYRVFLYDAKVLGVNAVHYQLLENKETVYMKELIEDGFLTAMKNPFDGKEYCDIFESKVIFEDENKKVNLLCGNYLIQQQPLEEEMVSIYLVSSWKEKKENDKQTEKLFYNYKIEGKMQLETFLEEELFLKTFNQQQATTYTRLEEIPKQYQILKKKMYRDEKLIKKMKY